MSEYHGIHPNLAEFALAVETLDPLPGNPRKGNVDAIAAALDTFGQVRPLVARRKDDGRYEILAGNHTFEAALRLDWTHVAVVVLDVDAEEGLAYAITDNRTVELGSTDDSLLYDALSAIIEDYGDLMEDLGWDEFELAVLDANMVTHDHEDTRGYVAPVLVVPVTDDDDDDDDNDADDDTPAVVPTPMVSPVARADAAGDVRLTAPESVDAREAVASGATAVNAAGTTRAVIQYTLTFDAYEQQKRWYEFMRYLRESSVYEGDTNVERLLNFVESHADF